MRNEEHPDMSVAGHTPILPFSFSLFNEIQNSSSYYFSGIHIKFRDKYVSICIQVASFNITFLSLFNK